MKKTLTMVVALAGMTAMAVPSYIFFQIDQASAGYSDYTFDYATVRAGGDYLTFGDGSYWKLYANDDGLTTEEIYAGAFDKSYAGSLTFELWSEDGDADPYVAIYSYAAWKNYAYADMYQAGATALVVSAVPEPASGLLLLLGLVGLALRRKMDKPRVRRGGQGLTALPIILVLSLFTFCLSPVTCRAAANDTLISFSTRGPDTYLDGATVKDGECYALVWTRAGATFEGLSADGKAVGSNSQVIVFAPVAKDGHCPQVVFELDAKLAAAYADGTYGIYLLDTRLASGAVGGVNAAGVPVAVNGYGVVDAFVPNASNGHESSASDAIGTIASAGNGISVTTKSALPANMPKPQISAIRLVGDHVFLTVRNTLPCLKYAAKEVSVGTASLQQQNEGNASSAAAVQGAASLDGEITIIAPKRGDSGFFSVGRD